MRVAIQGAIRWGRPVSRIPICVSRISGRNVTQMTDHVSAW
jgi:hypothetical protein